MHGCMSHALVLPGCVMLLPAALLGLEAACPSASCITDPLLLSALQKCNLCCKSEIKMRASILPESDRQLHPCWFQGLTIYTSGTNVVQHSREVGLMLLTGWL